MEENVTPGSEPPIVQQEIVNVDPDAVKKRIDWKRWWAKTERIGGAIRSWTITFIILFFAIVLLKLVLQEVNDKGYHIQAFRMPEEFVKDGYDGVTAAYILLDRVNNIIAVGNDTRSIKEVEEYQQSADRLQVQVEVSGVGISPDAIASYIKQAIGLNSKSIGGEIVRQGDTLKCFLRISGYPSEVVTQIISGNERNAALEQLIQKSAEGVMKKNNPLLLALFYAPEDDGYKDKAIDALRYAIQHRPDQAGDAYARWAHLIYWTYRDTTAAMAKVRKALEVDPNNAIAYRVWGHMWPRHPKGEQLLRKSLSIDSTSIFTWNDLGVYYMGFKPSRDEEASACFRKCYALDSTVTGPINWWTEVLFLQGKYKEANEKSEKVSYLIGRDLTVSLAISVAMNDSLEAQRKFRRLKERVNPQALAELLNEFAYEQELRNRYDLAFKLVRLSLSVDSTSRKAAFPYSTLAELYGLTGDKERFYTTIENALRLGLEIDRESLMNEPYKSLLSEDRLRTLKSRYKNQIQL